MGLKNKFLLFATLASYLYLHDTSLFSMEQSSHSTKEFLLSRDHQNSWVIVKEVPPNKKFKKKESSKGRSKEFLRLFFEGKTPKYREDKQYNIFHLIKTAYKNKENNKACFQNSGHNPPSIYMAQFADYVMHIEDLFDRPELKMARTTSFCQSIINAIIMANENGQKISKKNIKELKIIDFDEIVLKILNEMYFNNNGTKEVESLLPLPTNRDITKIKSIQKDIEFWSDLLNNLNSVSAQRKCPDAKDEKYRDAYIKQIDYLQQQIQKISSPVNFTI